MDKQAIIDEIRRTTAENNGAPLGRLRFTTLTGIQEHHWRGRHWARWNDALNEAGFAPIQKVRPYSDDYLLEAMTGLIRELKRFPVTSDIRLRTRGSDSFPFDTAFRRLGTKAQIAARIVDRLNDNQEFEDVLALCRPLVSSSSSAANAVTSGAQTQEGFVYLIQSGKRFKIGATNDLTARSKTIGFQMPDPTKTVHYIRTDDPFGIEAYWHRRFGAKRVNGEWFELGRAELAAFKRRKTM